MKKVRIILALAIIFFCSTLKANDSAILRVKQREMGQDIRFLANVWFEVYLINSSEAPIKIVDPVKSDRAYATHKSEDIVIAGNKTESSEWMVERPMGKYSTREIRTLNPGDSIRVYSFSIMPMDTVVHKVIVNHMQMVNPPKVVVDALGEETVEKMAMKLSTEFSFKPKYTPVTKDVFDDSYQELTAPPRISETNPSMRIIKYGTYSLTEALSGDSTNMVYKVKVNSDEMSLARFLPILKNIRWLQLNINNGDSIPDEITKLDKLIHLSVNGVNPSKGESPASIWIEPVKNLNKLYALELKNTYNPETPGWLSNLDNLGILRFINAFYEYTPVLGELTNVTELHIDGALKQHFPKEIKNISNIKNMNISRVYTSIPNEILTLPELENLTVSLFTDSVNFADCKAKKITIIQNNETDVPLTGMQSLAHLDSLFLRTKSSVMPDLGECNSLKYIKYENSNVTELPEMLTSAPLLQVLDIECRNLKVVSPEIGKMESLESLTFFRSKVQSLPNELALLTSLRRFSFIYGELNQFPTGLLNLPEIQDIILNNNQIKEIPKEIRALKSLKLLSMGSNKLTGLPIEIGELESLESLDLPSNEIESIPEEIGTLSNLKELNLINNQLRELPNSIFDLPSLEKLNLQRNPLRNSISRKLTEQDKFQVYQ